MSAAIALVEAPAARVLSPSQVNKFVDCAARWYYKHVAQLPDPPNSSLAFGRAMHATCGCYLNLRSQGETVTAADIADYYKHILTQELALAQLAPGDDPAALLDEGLRMLTMFCGQIAPQLEPAAVELQVHGLIGHQHVRGIVDVLDKSGTVIDIKTSSKKPGSISASYRLQLTTYGLLAGKAETRLITMARTKTPSWCQHSFTIKHHDLQLAATLYDMAAEAMQSGLYLPNRGSNLCSRKHCSFWRECTAEYGGDVQ
jgi:hypothetical protein